MMIISMRQTHKDVTRPLGEDLGSLTVHHSIAALAEGRLVAEQLIIGHLGFGPRCLLPLDHPDATNHRQHSHYPCQASLHPFQMTAATSRGICKQDFS